MRNFGFRDEETEDEANRKNFWTGFIAGGLCSAMSFIAIVALMLRFYGD